MEEENLILLTLDLDIPNLWENGLVKNFPDSTFTIKQGHSLGEDCFSGLLKIEGASFENVSNFLEENYPLISLERFHSDLNLYYFISPDEILPRVIRNSRSILNWPIDLMEENKRIKFILKNEGIEEVMCFLEAKGVEVKKFSKVKIDFNLKEILTPKQKEILTPSLDNGYYDFPKRISLNALAKKIGVSPSTLCVHLQKIESKIFNSGYRNLFFQRAV